MDLIDGIPDWLTCGVVIVAGTVALQFVQNWCERSQRQIGRDVDRWQSQQPGLQDAGLTPATAGHRPGRRGPPPRQAA